MQRIEVEGYLDSAKADLGSGVLTIVVKAKLSELPETDSEQLAEFSRNEMILALEISPYGKDVTVEVDGRLAGVKGDLVADIVTLTYRVMRNEIDTKNERILEQTTALHIKTMVACSARQKSFLEGTRFAGSKVELRVLHGGGG
jgi:hypothetical protein